MNAPLCPLCAQTAADRVLQKPGQDYWRCAGCGLVFVPRAQHLAPAAAAERYRQHRNDPGDPAYRAFLDRLLQPLIPRLPPGAAGLDYGSGPGPTIAVMLAERGFPMTNYDPVFAPDPNVLAQRYDFITCTETVEHFAEPAVEFARLDGLLRAGGWLGVMTQMIESAPAFATWWYHRDPTHIAFYCAAAMDWIARRHGWRCERPALNITLFQKPG